MRRLSGGNALVIRLRGWVLMASHMTVAESDSFYRSVAPSSCSGSYLLREVNVDSRRRSVNELPQFFNALLGGF